MKRPCGFWAGVNQQPVITSAHHCRRESERWVDLVEEPRTVEELNSEYLSFVARKLLRDESIVVTGFKITADPFEFPRFGDKQFFEIAFDYEGRAGAGQSKMILRVMPEMDAVMMLTGDTEHRELKAFEIGLYDQLPETFHTAYVHVVLRPEAKQYWAFLEDVRPQMRALGMHAALPDEALRTILSHLAAFHAAFWERRDVLDQPWLMRLERPVDYFYRCIIDIIDGMSNAAESTLYVVSKWPWLAEGVINLMDSLPSSTRRSIERLYREPEALLEKVRPLPKTLCHYDFDNRNLGIEQGPNGPRTIVIDWEIVGEGISSADAGRFLFYQQASNSEQLFTFYLDELERCLGRPIDRGQWRFGLDLATIAEWQIRGVLFGVMVSAPSAPIPAEQRGPMGERARADIDYVESLVRKHGLA